MSSSPGPHAQLAGMHGTNHRTALFSISASTMESTCQTGPLPRHTSPGTAATIFASPERTPRGEPWLLGEPVDKLAVLAVPQWALWLWRAGAGLCLLGSVWRRLSRSCIHCSLESCHAGMPCLLGQCSGAGGPVQEQAGEQEP